MAKKSRCPNRLEKYTGGGLQPRRCHIDFLPSVYNAERFMTMPSSSPVSNPNASSSTLSTHDLLNCVNLPGFSQCPTFRPLDDTRKVICDASTENSKRYAACYKSTIILLIYILVAYVCVKLQ